jgi:hypothetical protein
MEAGFREVDGAAVLAFAPFEAVDAVEPHAVRMRAVGIAVGQRRRVAAGVPFLAVHGAGMATDARVEIDDEAELFLARYRRHK